MHQAKNKNFFDHSNSKINYKNHRMEQANDMNGTLSLQNEGTARVINTQDN
jgi:hypothetical protein